MLYGRMLTLIDFIKIYYELKINNLFLWKTNHAEFFIANNYDTTVDSGDSSKYV